jgi:hypothetical protein
MIIGGTSANLPAFNTLSLLQGLLLEVKYALDQY